MAAPAMAASGNGMGGSGVVTTDITPVMIPPQAPCARGENNFGATTTISGTISDGSASYTGPITFNWDIDQTNGPWYEDPSGTFGSSQTCASGHAGDPWEITGSASGTNTAGSTVNCTFTSGTYTRSNDIDLVVTLDGECDIQEDPPDGTDSVNDSATSVELLQTLDVCTSTTPPPETPESCTTTSDSFTAT